MITELLGRIRPLFRAESLRTEGENLRPDLPNISMREITTGQDSEVLRQTLEENRKLEVRIDRLEQENRQLKADIEDLVKQVDQKTREAEKATPPRKQTQSEKILYTLEMVGVIGATRNTLASAVGLDPATVSSRLTELERQGKIVHDSRYRPETGPKRAKVWVVRKGP